MKKLLASTTAVLALTAAAVTGVPGAPGSGVEAAEAKGCSTWQYKVESATPIANGREWADNAYRGYYITSSKPWLQTVYLGENYTPRRLMEVNKVYTPGKSDISGKYREYNTDRLYVSKTRLDYITCW